jgi:ATP-binding protein involved in chromosome partitioning
MAWFTPAELPQNRYYLFGREGTKQLAEAMQVPLLGQIPIVQSICENGDNGTPAALSSDTATGLAFRALAEEVVRQTDLRNASRPGTTIVELKK